MQYDAYPYNYFVPSETGPSRMFTAYIDVEFDPHPTTQILQAQVVSVNDDTGERVYNQKYSQILGSFYYDQVVIEDLTKAAESWGESAEPEYRQLDFFGDEIDDE